MGQILHTDWIICAVKWVPLLLWSSWGIPQVEIIFSKITTYRSGCCSSACKCFCPWENTQTITRMCLYLCDVGSWKNLVVTPRKGLLVKGNDLENWVKVSLHYILGRQQWLYTYEKQLEVVSDDIVLLKESIILSGFQWVTSCMHVKKDGSARYGGSRL